VPWMETKALDFERATGWKIRLVVRRHPKETSAPRSVRVRDERLAAATVEDLLLGADLFVGWDSMMLVEGWVAGVPAVSLVHCGEEFQAVDLRRIGLKTRFEQPAAFAAWLTAGYLETLGARRVPERSPLFVHGATDRAERLLRSALDPRGLPVTA